MDFSIYSLPYFEVKVYERPFLFRNNKKNAEYRYVDGTPTPVKIQISHFLEFGQFYIDVYSICNFYESNILHIRRSYQQLRRNLFITNKQ